MSSVICLSGGVDSTVLAYHLKSKGHDLHAIVFDYGQTHAKEIIAAKEIAQQLGIPSTVSNFGDLVGRGQDLLTGGAGSPVVANRNATMLTLAATYAVGIGCDSVFYSPTVEDFKLFPDCRPKFVEDFNSMLSSSNTPVKVFAPFIAMTKREIVQLGKKYDVPFEKTWSCYVGGEKPCGECLACKTRQEAFQCI